MFCSKITFAPCHSLRQKKNMEHDPWQFLNRFVIFHHNPILILDLFISGACMGGI